MDAYELNCYLDESLTAYLQCPDGLDAEVRQKLERLFAENFARSLKEKVMDDDFGF
jgi:hypothetical protein